MRDYLTKDDSRLFRSIDRITLVALTVIVGYFGNKILPWDVLGAWLYKVLLFMIGLAVVLVFVMDVFDFTDSMFDATDDELDEEHTETNNITEFKSVS